TCPNGEITEEWAATVEASFHAAHRALYGYDFAGRDDQQVEWVNLRVTGIGPIPRPDISDIAGHGGSLADAVIETRPVFYDAWGDATIYDRAKLAAGHHIVGP